MTATARKPRSGTTRRAGAVKLTVGLLWFLGLTALGGGIEMLIFRKGNGYLPAESSIRSR